MSHSKKQEHDHSVSLAAVSRLSKSKGNFLIILCKLVVSGIEKKNYKILAHIYEKIKQLPS